MAYESIVDLNEFIVGKISTIEVELEATKNLESKNIMNNFKETLESILDMIKELGIESDDNSTESDVDNNSNNDDADELGDDQLEESEYEDDAD
jgi:hypothetical protein